MNDLALSMVLLGVGGVLLMAAAAYSDYEHWRDRKRRDE